MIFTAQQIRGMAQALNDHVGPGDPYVSVSPRGHNDTPGDITMCAVPRDRGGRLMFLVERNGDYERVN